MKLEGSPSAFRAFILVAGFISVVGLFLQLRQTTYWKKVEVQHTLAADLPSYDLEKEVWKTIIDLGGDPTREITPDIATGLRDSLMYRLLIKTYLNKFETFCAATRAGLIDRDYAYRVYRFQIIRAYRIFKDFILVGRAEYGNDKLYCELQHVAEKWASDVREIIE